MAEKTTKKKPVEKKEKPKKEVAAEKPSKSHAEKVEASKEEEKKETKEKAKETQYRTYVIPLKEVFGRCRTKRAKNASRVIKEFMSRHIKKGEVKIDPNVNELIHSGGRCNIPRRVKVIASTEGDKTTVKLAE